MSTYTEDHLVEQPAIQLMQHELGWDVVNCFGEWTLLRQPFFAEATNGRGFEGQGGGVSALGREGKPSPPRLRRPRREVVLVSRLRPALQRLNPDLPVEAIEGAVAVMPGARRSGYGLRRDATATFCWTIGSICALRDSDIPCNWNL